MKVEAMPPGQLQQIIDLMPVAVYACDADGRITCYNHLAVDLWGTEPNDSDRFCAFRNVRLADGTAVSREETPIALAIREGKSFRNVEASAERADGSQLSAVVNVDPLRDQTGKVCGAINAFQDISNRKKTDAEIYRLAAIVESSDDAIIGKSLDGFITNWNAGAQRLLGYSAAEVVGKHIGMLIPLDRANEQTTILDRIRRGEHIDHYETVRRRRDGSLVDVSLTISPIRDATGRVIGASKIARDIGRLKRIEDNLRLADQRKNQFLATLAHELRGPLAPLRNSVQIMRLADTDRSSIDEALEIMDRQLRQMGRLIDDLLDIGRITNGKLVLRKSRVVIAETIRDAVDACRGDIEAAGHTLTVELPRETDAIHADSARLTQVFSNLLNNAVKYTPPGGNIRIGTARHGNDIVIRIADSGIGIAPERLSDIFDLFMQVERSLEKNSGGLGIGLTLAQQLVSMHGGNLEAHSDGLGSGSVFTVSLPLPPPKQDSHKPNSEKSGADQHPSRRVLVVDDNVDSARSLAMMLKILGHETHLAHDGLAAVEAAAEFSPEIILMDIGMPKLNGFDACRRIRAETTGAQPLIMALTGWGQREDRQRCLEAGFDVHLVKPLEPQTLIRALENPARLADQAAPSAEVQTGRAD